MPADEESIGARLRAAREAPPYWSRAEMARRLRGAADPRKLPDIPHVASLVSMIKQWEAGRYTPGRRYRPLYARVTGLSESFLFGRPTAVPPAAPVGPREADYAAAVRDTNAHLVVLDCRYGGTSIADVAVQAFGAARAVVATGRHNADERDLQAAAGETGEIAAWCLYDADRLSESRATTHEAMFISRLAGDRSMELFQLSHLALIDVHQRHGREALRIAEHTIDGGRLAPRVEALFKLRAARALAQGGQRQRALVTLDQAAGTLQESLHPRDPYWTWWLDASELDWHRGILHMELGELETAMPYLDQAAHGRLLRDPYAPPTCTAPVTARGEEWGRAAYNDLVHLLLALALAGAWRETEAITATVSDFTREVVSARTEVMLKSAVKTVLRAGYGAGGPSSTLIDLVEQIAEVRGWDVRPDHHA
ncbi:helix-turn-helix domain-containing protein [Spirillospora sp. CA-253888]